MQAEKAKKMFLGGEGAERLAALLSCSREAAADESRRIVRLIEEFETRFGADRDVKIFRAPGRTEICGNHTDHQGGRVLARPHCRSRPAADFGRAGEPGRAAAERRGGRQLRRRARGRRGGR